MGRLAEAGAPGLALDLLDLHQPAFETDSGGWLLWERERVRLLETTSDWAELASRLDHLPEGLPAEARRWATATRVRALLALGDSMAARQVLLRALWCGKEIDVEAIREARRLLIEVYLAEKQFGDAYAAMLRYGQDYGGGGRDERLLEARVLLSNGRAADAHSLIHDLRHHSLGGALHLLAGLRSGQPAKEVVRQARARMKGAPANGEARQLLLAVTAEAAAGAQDITSRVIALEALFSEPLPAAVQDLFQFEAEDLWQAYTAYAESVGNRQQLLVGDDAAWFKAAQEAGRTYPVRVHSIYALVARKGSSYSSREQAHQRLAESLLEREGGTEILKQLYLGRGHLAGEELPLVIRHMLADQAVARGELAVASKVLKETEQPPEGVDPLLWQLRRAKVFILAGNYAAGADVLAALVDATQLPPREQLDRIIQVIFDLQTVAEHEQAYGLLNRLQRRVTDGQLRRELLYWMAESRQAQKRYRDAARLYLASATLPGLNAMDPWAQTSRYQAAQALAKVGLTFDAGNLYRQLLKATDDPGRRAVLMRDLEQLKLQRPATGAPES